MKSGIAMMVSALIRAKSEGLSPPGDVILALVADEEAGGDCGARYLVEHHPELFESVKYAIGEFGGFTFHLGGRRFYPIMVAEKQVCRLRVTARGAGGHGSLFQQDNPMGAMGRFLQTVQTRDLPTHITPVTRMMFQAIGKHLPMASRAGIGALLRPELTNRALRLMGAKGRTFNPLFRNTVNATMVRGGDQVNVVPREVTAELDGRILPGFGPDDLISEIRAIAGPKVDADVSIEVTHFDPGPSTPDMGLFETLAKVLKDADEGATPVPMLMPASTDGRLFAKLGIQSYGFLPMKLPEEFDFAETIHGSGERIPVEAIRFGSKAIYKLLQRFEEGSSRVSGDRFSVDG
jgi:acetylornithine deacetylase/succinyl-diaminopimelate desuccinylase-like protein